eukprot:jgi/Chrpa1/26176/Chrysochromulina_OHIO_Genome00001159-RA
MPLATAALLITIAANIANNSSAGFRSIEVYIGTKQYESARVGTHETVVTKTKAGIKGMKGVDTKGSWHSQSGQDKTIAKLHGLKRGGFFIDLASNEPIHLSNTRTLERDLGWNGVCIDANAELLQKSIKYRTCRCVQAVVTDQSGDTVSFTTPVHARSTAMSNSAIDTRSGFGSVVGLLQVDPTHPTPGKLGSNRAGWREQQLVTVALQDLLRYVNAPSVIDYLSLDVEGAEESVLGPNFPFAQFTFLSLTVERPSSTLRERLRAHSYLFVGEHGCYGDQLWVHASFASQAERVLQLPQPLSPTRDAGRELWFANCSVRGSPSEHALHTHMTSINS